jgi:hypothetical protein
MYASALAFLVVGSAAVARRYSSAAAVSALGVSVHSVSALNGPQVTRAVAGRAVFGCGSVRPLALGSSVNRKSAMRNQMPLK